MSLLRAELRRLALRRLTRWMLLLVVLLLATVVVAVAADQVRWVTADPTRPPAYQFRRDFADTIHVFTGLLAMFGFILGASFIGAEWRSGGMLHLLLWRPGRLRVFSAKLAALLVVLLGLWVVLAPGWTAVFWVLANYGGHDQSMTAGAWLSLGLTGARGLALVLAASTLAFALASLGRHTAAAMGTVIGALVIGVAGVGVVVGGLFNVRFFEAWLWTTYLAAWLEGSYVVYDWGSTEAIINSTPDRLEITWPVAGAGIAAVVVLVLGAALWQLRRRDVT